MINFICGVIIGSAFSILVLSIVLNKEIDKKDEAINRRQARINVLQRQSKKGH